MTLENFKPSDVPSPPMQVENARPSSTSENRMSSEKNRDSRNDRTDDKPAPSLTYEQALAGTIGRLTKSGNGVSIAKNLMTSQELDRLATELITATGAPSFIANMPRNFTQRRLSQMASSNFPVPYINHEGLDYRPYSLTTKSSSRQLDESARSKGLTVIGITPLDHAKALYGVAVAKTDGSQYWMVVRVTEAFAAYAQNGNGPEASKVHSAVSRAFGLLQN